MVGARRVDPEAYEAYLKGRHLWERRTEDSLRKGIAFFEEAIQRDMKYAVAYVGMADSYALLALRGAVPSSAAFPRAEAAIQRALELDPKLGEAHATLAHLRKMITDIAARDSQSEALLRAMRQSPH